MTNIGSAITAYTVPGAVKYKFEVVNGGTTQYIERTDRWFYFAQLGSYLPGTAYTIRVASSSDGTTFSAYGPTCVITTPVDGRIYANLCGTTLPTMSSAVTAYQVPGAVKYKFKVVNGGTTQYIERTDRWFYFTQLGSRLNNTAYDVSVATSSDGTNFSAFGPVCVITTPATGMARENSDITWLDEEFSLEAFPNPNNGEFTISASHEGTFNLVNELGQLIQTIEITKENNYQVHLGMNRDSSATLQRGVYFITGTINGNIVTKKVMVL